MIPQFQVTQDPSGNLTVTGGWVIETRGTARFYVADYSFPLSTLEGIVTVGGSGRNVRVSGGPNTLVPVGIFKGYTALKFAGELFPDAEVIIGVDDSLQISDGTDVLAGLPAGGLATTSVPMAPFSVPATTYGKDTYNGGSPFSLSLRREAGSFTFPGLITYPASGTAPGDTFTATDAEHFTGDADPTWTITVNGDGTADLSDAFDIVATRAEVMRHEAAGHFLTTTYGADTYNDSKPFEFVVAAIVSPTVAGYVWVEVTESSPGVPTGAAGPFFGATLPTPSGGTFAVPLAYSDGLGTVQPLHTGAILIS